MWHLGVRFLGSLAPIGPRGSSQQWALDHLGPEERQLFAQMSGPDRRHAIGVARRALRLAAENEQPSGSEGDGSALPEAFVAAALLHDVGKIEAQLGTFGRVWATLAALALGRQRVVQWDAAGAGGRVGEKRRSMARYLEHDRLGADLLQRAGSDELTICWARQHHLPETRWTLDGRLGGYLKQADGD